MPLAQVSVTLNRLLEQAAFPTIPFDIVTSQDRTTITLDFYHDTHTKKKKHSPAKFRRDAKRKRQYMEKRNLGSRAESMSTLSLEEGENGEAVRGECASPVITILEETFPCKETVNILAGPDNMCTAMEKRKAPIVSYFFVVTDSIRKGQGENMENTNKLSGRVEEECVPQTLETVPAVIMQEAPAIPARHDLLSVPAEILDPHAQEPDGTDEDRTRKMEELLNNSASSTKDPGIFSTAVGWVRGLIHPPTIGEPFWV